MFAYLNIVRKSILEFAKSFIKQLPKSKNLNTDMLANLGSSISLKFKKTIPIEILAHLK